ncbi:hypothetical protein [Hyphomicrobium sp.]|jgi:hypothetical protein|uniref:hypothetical protein n=1 Tax=Hyphomicrobium sp. TaxID=82 RepID=UPI0035685A32
MAWPSRAPLDTELDFTPPPQDLGAMAEVLESKHGIHAAGIAEFFALYHGQKGDAGRSWAWTGVAELVRTRERERIDDANSH